MKLFRSMKKRFWKRNIQSLCILAGVIGIASIKSLMACGDFRMPSNHFEGVTSRGYVSIWKQLDALDLGDTSVPILLGVQTYRAIPSGELGSGWLMPLFDSGIVQRDENTFDMITPDGTMDFFYRDGSDPSVLHGSSGWTGEIQGNDVIVHSKCGSGWKMVFRQGRLDTLSKGSHELKIQRDPLNRPTGITENGVTRMALTRDEKTGLMRALEMNGKKYLFGYEGKPRVETVGGQNLVGGVDSSLHEIIHPDGKKETHDLAVTDKMLPNLKITDAQGKERMIVWGTDGKIIQDGEWSYKITPSREAGVNAAIERTNIQKQKEYWFKDDPNGKETTVAKDGTKTERSWFTSGVLAGKERKEVIELNNNILNKKNWGYDDQGRKTIESNNSSTIRYKLNINGDISSFIKLEEKKSVASYEKSNSSIIQIIKILTNASYQETLKKNFTINEVKEIVKWNQFYDNDGGISLSKKDSSGEYIVTLNNDLSYSVKTKCGNRFLVCYYDSHDNITTSFMR
ncbi:MAG: hypothetical protein NTW91_10800 [Verrucomicrobia bacterium]|nr:hypothetical protein [Verrucomicrobiota bacterium]